MRKWNHHKNDSFVFSSCSSSVSCSISCETVNPKFQCTHAFIQMLTKNQIFDVCNANTKDTVTLAYVRSTVLRMPVNEYHNQRNDCIHLSHLCVTEIRQCQRRQRWQPRQQWKLYRRWCQAKIWKIITKKCAFKTNWIKLKNQIRRQFNVFSRNATGIHVWCSCKRQQLNIYFS